MTTVVCVLRSGGDFRPEHAVRLYDQFLAHSPPAVHFVCLSDQCDELENLHVPCTPLEHRWPGWWSKIETFQVPGPVLYLDLDVTIIGRLTPLLLEAVRARDLIMCGGFWGAEDPNKVNSSVMAWRGDVSRIYQAFLEAPEAHMSIYHQRNKPQKWGDQAFVRDHLGAKPAIWHDVLPGKVVSFKREVALLKRFPWQDACVVVSHGQPRPWARDGADAWLAQRRRVA